MIIICEECGKKYRVDPEKIKSPKSSFKCKICDHVITVHKKLVPDTVLHDKEVKPSSLDIQDPDISFQSDKTVKVTDKKTKPDF